MEIRAVSSRNSRQKSKMRVNDNLTKLETLTSCLFIHRLYIGRRPFI